MNEELPPAVTAWVLAIDFGTTFTSAAIREDGRPALVRMPSPEGPRDVMPSAVFLPAGGELVVGWVAENQAVLAPDRFEPTPKRRLGVDEHLLLGGDPAPVAAAVAAILERVLAEARRSRGGTTPSLVSLTHPASWAGGRVEALVDAAHRAGIEAPRLLSEPEAAALHFVTDRVDIGGLVAVYDLGGGTFDAAVLQRVGEASFRLAGRPGGRDGLGGEEFDRKLYEHVAKQLAFEAPEHWARIRANPRSHRDFRLELRRAKEALSYSAAHDVYLPEAQERSSWRVTREEFEDLIRPDLDTSVEILAVTLAEAGVADPSDRTQLSDIYLAGGSSRIPLVADVIGKRFGRVPRSLDEPKSVVALGASTVQRAGEPAPPLPPSPPPPSPPSRDVPEPELEPTLQKTPPAPAPVPVDVTPEPEPAPPTVAPSEPAPEPRPAVPAGDALVLGLALAGAALALFGTAVASARGVTRIVASAEWSAIEAVGVPVAVLVACVALRTARGHGLREVGLLLGLGVQMTLGAAGWLILLARENDGSPRFQFLSPLLAVPTLIGALLVLAAAVIAWRRRRASEPAVEPSLRVRRVAALATLAGVALTVAAVRLLRDSDFYDTFFSIGKWFLVEPIGSAACALGLAVLVALAARRTALAAGALLALGLQSLLYFLPYVGPWLAVLDRPELEGALGLLGALLITGAGVALWLASEVRVPPQDELRWPARLVAAGAVGVLAGFAVSSSRSWAALSRPDGSGVPDWAGTTWHFLEAIAVPALVAAALLAVVRSRRARAFPAGLLLGFGAQTLVAAIAALVFVLRRDEGPAGPLVIVVAAAIVLAVGSVAVAYRVRRDADGEADGPPPRPWIVLLGFAGAACTAGALLLPDVRDQFGDARSFVDVNNWLILEPAVAAVLLAASATALLLRPALRLLAAGVLAAVGAQTFLWFVVPVGVALSEPFDIVSLGLGSVVGTLGAIAAMAAGALAYRRPAPRATPREAIVEA